MALRLTIISQHARSLGERATKEFGESGGTLGRSLDCDWSLPDAQRFLSSRHASIDFRSGSYYVVDTSTNGVFVNGSERPVGRGKPQRLFNGDRIRIGDYELAVEVEGDDETSLLAEENHIDPVDLAQRVEEPEPTLYTLVDATEITGIGVQELLTEDEAETLSPMSALDSLELEIVDEPPPAPKAARAEASAEGRNARAAANAAPGAKSAPSAATTQRSAPRAAGAQSAAPSTAPQRLDKSTKPAAQPAGLGPVRGKPTNVLDPFFRGAGLTGQRVDAEQAEAILLRLGQLMREMILGVSESLHLRAEQKDALRLPSTTIQQQNNNPLKFSASVEEALANLLFHHSQEYLPAIDAVREACTDLRLHQQALLKALRTALVVYAKRLDPEELEQKFSRGRSGVIMGAANKLKYWDLYKDVYQLVADHPPGDFSAQFLDDFARAYEEELARAGRGEGRAKAKAG